MFARRVPDTSVLFVSRLSLDSRTIESYHLKKKVSAVRNCRNITKADMKFNDLMPKMTVDPESYDVTADGEPCMSEPGGDMPLAQAYYAY